MLCRRAIVKHTLSVRCISTQEDLLARVAGVTSQPTKPINPLTHRPTPETDVDVTPDADAKASSEASDRPPAATGPRVYNTPGKNPLTRKFRIGDWADSRSAVRPTHRFDCVTSRNNTITTFSSLTYSKNPFDPPTSNVLAWFSGGSVGFKKAQRASFEAGHQCAVRVFKLIEETQDAHPNEVRVHLYLKGFGMGREAVKTALLAAEGEKIRDTIKQVIDRTPIKIGGTRAKKTRRL